MSMCLNFFLTVHIFNNNCHWLLVDRKDPVQHFSMMGHLPIIGVDFLTCRKFRFNLMSDYIVGCSFTVTTVVIWVMKYPYVRSITGALRCV